MKKNDRFVACDTFCDSFMRPRPRIVLRNRIFYLMFEITEGGPKANNGVKKRKFIRKSLHTSNYFMARQIVQDWLGGHGPDFGKFAYNEIEFNNKFEKKVKIMALSPRKSPAVRNVLSAKKKAEMLYKNGTVFEELSNLMEKIKVRQSSSAMCALSQINLNEPFELDVHNDFEDMSLFAELSPYARKMLDKLISKSKELDNELRAAKRQSVWDNEHIGRLEKLIETQQKIIEAQADCVKRAEYVAPAIRETLDSAVSTSVKSDIGKTIGDILDLLRVASGKTKDSTTRKIAALRSYFKLVGLKETDAYSKFHTRDVVQKIFNDIVDHPTNLGNTKKKHVRWVCEFVRCATRQYPDEFNDSIIAVLPGIDATKKHQKNPHIPYTEDALKEIFNPKHTFFNKNAKNRDVFWGILIALFIGARQNAAFTLQYKDIIKNEKGIWCFNFTEEGHKIKHLKTEESQRVVPIHQTLIDMGFLDYVSRQKVRNKDTDMDFIFKVCITKGGVFNNHIVRGFFKFLTDIGVRDNSGTRYDFHSFRKNANIRMEKCGITSSYINKLIGWEGVDTREKSYSNYTIPELYDALCLLNYDFLQPEFDYWKEVMSKI